MDRICDLPSFIVTGASASGKTTLIEQALPTAIRIYPHIRQDYLGQVRYRMFAVFFSEKSSLRATFVKDYI